MVPSSSRDTPARLQRPSPTGSRPELYPDSAAPTPSTYAVYLPRCVHVPPPLARRPLHATTRHSHRCAASPSSSLPRAAILPAGSIQTTACCLSWIGYPDSLTAVTNLPAYPDSLSALDLSRRHLDSPSVCHVCVHSLASSRPRFAHSSPSCIRDGHRIEPSARRLPAIGYPDSQTAVTERAGLPR